MIEPQAAAPPTVFDDADPELARTYAEALVNAAAKTDSPDEILDELDAIHESVTRTFPAFAALMASPVKNAAEKDAALVRTFEGRTLPTSIQFLRVLNRHGRLGLLGHVLRLARALSDRRQGRRPVTVRSAIPLDAAQQDALRARLAGALQASPVLHLEIDPALIGGLVVQVGDDVYDASVRNRLEQIRQRLIEGKTHEIQSRRDHFSHPE